MNHRYHYRVLGTAQALLPDGTEVPVKGARLRALLTALAAGGGRTVPARELVAQVWGEAETPPVDAAAALQALVGRLRRVLGREAVVSVPDGYRLAADRDDIDLFRFERLAAEGSAALTGGGQSGGTLTGGGQNGSTQTGGGQNGGALSGGTQTGGGQNGGTQTGGGQNGGTLTGGDAAKAAALLDEALALWRGPALADLPGRDSDPLSVRAHRRRREARRARLAAEVALGRADSVLDELAELSSGEPLDEPLQALRIRALRAAGRRAEALQAYEEVRTGLSERLGTDPGPELRALHAELLAGKPGEVAEAPEREKAPRGNLRARLTSFVGRNAELAELAGELRARRLVTLLGPGGVGKTRLSLEAAAAVTQGWPDGVWVAELAPVRDEGTVPEAVLTALGARETVVRGTQAARATQTPPDEPLEELVERCGRRRMLLVLDNCEHMASAAAELAETVLARCPGVTVLATSREPLAVPGEFVRPVGPLPQDAALRLLADRGAAARPGFRIDDDPLACAEICRRLDGLPLAVELAAARLRALTARQIADRLDDRFRLLTGGSRTALPRQQTLRAVVDWSWELLDGNERAVLRRLAVFSGGCDPAEAEAVCGAGLPDSSDTLGVLASLVDKSLVVAAPAGPRGMRYRLLETVAEYAAERLDEAGEREAVERRHLAVYRELVRTGDPRLRGPLQAEWLERFEAEHENVRTALRTAVALREEQEALCLALSMSWFWQLRGHLADARTWSAAAAGLGPDPFGPPVRKAVPLYERCTDEPPPWSPEQLWEARRGMHLQVLASHGVGDATSLEDPQTRAQLAAIVAAYRPGMPQTCRQPGTMWFFARLMTGEFTSFGETMNALVRGCREHGGAWDLGLALLMRAKLLDDDPDDAEQALARFERAGDQWGIAESLSARGEAYERRGRYAEAAADFERAMEGSVRIGARTQVPLFKAQLACVRLENAADTAAAERAEKLLAEAVEEGRAYAGEAAITARGMLAQRYGRTGRTGLAREQLRQLEEEFSVGTPALFTGMVAGLYGWLDCLDGEYGRAGRRIGAAVRDLESLAYLVAPHLVVSQFPVAAWVKARLGAASDGARLLGAYDHQTALPESFGFHQFRPEAEAEIRRRAGAKVRAVLDDATYERAYAEGGGLALREAAALV
ncbi:BTAD domain-containing putative transcriptional regulator [Streptomyces sp. ISL-98]|uniref:AfsR/SARP family transcriptional regulator n=1 Tax=Streptomyces sp. ISL-98 TaxID=2819192 RepID=UPI0027E518DE|nr:BTAD domain-containing putative transcriptional regulator [Streptomyces sp. ISL-98]